MVALALRSVKVATGRVNATASVAGTAGEVPAVNAASRTGVAPVIATVFPAGAAVASVTTTVKGTPSDSSAGVQVPVKLTAYSWTFCVTPLMLTVSVAPATAVTVAVVVVV